MTTTGTNRPGTVVSGLNALWADPSASHVKTKNFHWHLSGPAFPRLPPPVRRPGVADVRHNRRDCRTRAQARRPNAEVDWPGRAPAALDRQRGRGRDRARHARRVAAGQPLTRRRDARAPYAMR